MSSKYGRIFGVAILVLASSLFDIKIIHNVHATTNNITTMKLKDVSVGSVINLGDYSYVKIADNQFMQTQVATCPDRKIVAGKYAKCFPNEEAVDSHVGSAVLDYIADSFTLDDVADTSNCDHFDGIMQNWGGCSDLEVDDIVCLVNTDKQKTYRVKKFADGQCYTFDDIISTSTNYSNANNLCRSITGWSLPTKAQYENIISVVGSSNMPDVWCEGQCGVDHGWWSITESSANHAYNLHVNSTSAFIFNYTKTYNYEVRCIKK